MIITLCGSTKFKDLFERVNRELTLNGHIVLAPGVFHHADEVELTEEQKIELDNIHKIKINMSDAIYVINPNQYIGSSTYGEIDWAKRNNKEIYFLEPLAEKEEDVNE